MYPIIEFAGKTIGTYALCTLTGLLFAGWTATRLGKREGLAFEDIVIMMLSICAGLFLGGHLLYGITQIGEINNIINQRNTISGREFFQKLYHCLEGMVYYGGFFGACAALKIVQRNSPMLQAKRVFDIFAVNVPLFHAFARIGCFFGGCCYGIPCKVGFLITDNIMNPAVNGVRRFPVALLESTVNFLIFSFLLKMHKNNKQSGVLLKWYMLLYGTARFFLEYLRGDEIRGFLWIFSTSQWISFVLVLYSVITIYSKRHPA